jgi:23S rRNA (uracil1939-C5)-methyltransferase
MARIFQPKKPSIDKKHHSAVVEKFDHQGAGIAYWQNKPVFIAGALPTETVLFQLQEQKSKFATAKLIKVQAPAKERTSSVCAHYEQCGGCDMQHASRALQVDFKQQKLKELMAKFAGQKEVTLAPAITGQDVGYRRRTRISLRVNRKTGQLDFGFRARNSQNIIALKQCPVLAEPLNALLPELKALLVGYSKPQELGHIELVLADSGIVFVLRTTAKVRDKDRLALESFAEQHHIALYLHQADTPLEQLTGEQTRYHIDGLALDFEPTNFIQVNAEINQQMVSQALDWLELEENDQVLDLFCGVGNFSLPIAKRAAHVVGIEGVDEMVAQASRNAKANQLSNIDFYQANLQQPLGSQEWGQAQYNKVLLDPARAGAAGIVDQLAELGAQQVVYVSCNASTLARDADSLIQQGFRLEKLGMLDMFPHTSHLESMALFIK